LRPLRPRGSPRFLLNLKKRSYSGQSHRSHDRRGPRFAKEGEAGRASREALPSAEIRAGGAFRRNGPSDGRTRSSQRPVALAGAVEIEPSGSFPRARFLAAAAQSFLPVQSVTFALRTPPSIFQQFNNPRPGEKVRS